MYAVISAKLLGTSSILHTLQPRLKPIVALLTCAAPAAAPAPPPPPLVCAGVQAPAAVHVSPVAHCWVFGAFPQSHGAVAAAPAVHAVAAAAMWAIARPVNKVNRSFMVSEVAPGSPKGACCEIKGKNEAKVPR